MVRLVLFDVDGTLIQTGGAGVKAFAKTLESVFGITNGTERIRFGGRTDPSLVRELFQHTGVVHDADTVRRFFDAYVFWLDHLLGQSRRGRVCPGVLSLIQGLRQFTPAPCIGLLTGNIRLGAEIKLRHFGIWELFETGAYGDDNEDRNLIAAVARDRASQLLGRSLTGAEIVVVGDTPRDIECGRAIKAKVLAVATGGTTCEQLATHEPDWVVPDLTHITAEQLYACT